MSRRVITLKDAELLKSTLMANGIHKGPVNQEQEDSYTSRITKYIPAEIVSAFIAIDGILKAASEPAVTIYWLIFAFCLVLTPVYTWRITVHEDLPPATGQIIISTLSFICWAMAFGGPFVFYGWYKPYIGSIAVIIATLVFPLFTNIKGSKKS